MSNSIIDSKEYRDNLANKLKELRNKKRIPIIQKSGKKLAKNLLDKEKDFYQYTHSKDKKLNDRRKFKRNETYLKEKKLKTQERLNKIEETGKDIKDYKLSFNLNDKERYFKIYYMDDNEFDIFLDGIKQDVKKEEEKKRLQQKKLAEYNKRLSIFREEVLEEDKEPFKKVFAITPELFKNATFFKLPDSININVLDTNPDAFLIHRSTATDSIILCHNGICMLFRHVFNGGGYMYNSNYEQNILTSKINEQEKVLRKMIYNKRLKRSPKVIQQREDRITEYKNKLDILEKKNSEFYSMERGYGQTFALIVVAFEDYFGEDRENIVMDFWTGSQKYDNKYLFSDGRYWGDTIKEMKIAKGLRY